jgi:uncharacterized protein (DUF2141 family)
MNNSIKTIKLEKYYSLFTYIIIISIVISSCAKVVAPTGGEKDETPPSIVLSTPENMATNFTDKKVVIKFDEYISLQDVTQELLITPVQEENPEIKLRNKSLVIHFKDSLEKNSTYNLNFYNAIRDINEGNILKNYQYIFSTGDMIDTLFVVGHVYDAFNLEFPENVLVMLYKNLEDSVPQTQKPTYVTRADEDGSFSINNITPGSYKLFALQDANRNMIFDQPGEPIAFIDSLVSPKVKLAEVFDTLQILNEEDSTYYDSIYSTIVVVPATNELHLMLFTEDFENQYIEESKRPANKELTIDFNRALTEPVEFSPLNFIQDSSWFVYETNVTNDFVTLWVTDSNIYKKDSIYLALEYLFKDSLENWVPKIDTVNFLFVEEVIEEKSRRERRKEEQEKDTVKIKIPSELNVKFSADNNSEYDFDKKLFVNFNYPLKKTDLSKIKVYYKEDTLEIEQDFELIRDSIEIRKYTFETELQTEFNYKLVADSGAFIDIYNNINDSTGVSFRVKKLEKYGTIFLSLEKNETPGILQIMSEKEDILKTIHVHQSDSILELKYLSPKKYRLKYFADRNNNGKWDTGKYEEKLQPEPVFYYPKEIEVKENWDYDISWDLLND